MNTIDDIRMSSSSSSSLSVILRDVDVNLSEADALRLISSATDICASGIVITGIKRMMRTSRGATPHLLPLLRVFCESELQRSLLLKLGGLILCPGCFCAAEAPLTSDDSPAALGRFNDYDDASVSAFIASPAFSHAVRHSPKTVLPKPHIGEAAYIFNRGHFRDGRHGLWTEEMEASKSDKVCAWPLYSRSTQEKATAAVILVCAETIDYHRAVRAFVCPDDNVVEIGCDDGRACAVAAQSCGPSRVLGIDLALLSVTRARAAFPEIRFEQLDVLQRGGVAAIRALVGGGVGDDFSVVLIDVNGNRGIGCVVRVLQVIINELHPTLIIVKSRALASRICM